MALRTDQKESKAKKKYKVRNWKEYNRSLVNRGRITLWFEEDSIRQWYNKQKSGRRGASNTYSDTAVQCGLTLREVFNLPLRAAEGLVSSLIELMKLKLDTPNYTTFCRRQKDLKVNLPHRSKGKGLHIVVDSTGLKVYGEGEWKVRKHGVSKRRTWRKLHLAVEESTQEILMSVLSTNDFKDSEVLEDLIDPIEEDIGQISADGAYDTFDIHDFLKQKGIHASIPPQKNAKIKHPEMKESPLLRNRHIREIEQIGRKEWKVKHNYHRRSLSETAMFRIKQIFGNRLKNRDFEHQAVEAFIRCAALNKMTQLGMPLSYPVI